MTRDTAFDMLGSTVRFGAGVTAEVGPDLADLGARRVLVVTDPTLAALEPVGVLTDSLDRAGVTACVYNRVAIEPTEQSFQDAIAFARDQACDAFVGIGGGSSIDTAKAANLYSTHPPTDFLDYVNAPIGKAMPVPGPLAPLMAVPTTAGTGSETTGVCVFDFTTLKAKTGISSRALKPTRGYLDPENTRTLPAEVAASAGLDILSHAVESYTAIPFDARPQPARPSARPTYQGANPISDIWSREALRMVAESLVRAVEDRDEASRAQMILAACYAGIGFGNAGVHLPHAMSYPVSGNVRTFVAAGYPAAHPLVPHGMSVILNAPAALRFTAAANPARHLEAAAALGADVSRAQPADAGRILADRITWFMERLKMPNGLAAIGYMTDDVPTLVEGTLLQQRLTALSPRPAGAEELAAMFHDALTAY